MSKFEYEDGRLWLGDCLELMKDIPDGSVDMILCDLPYGTTQNKWDSVLPYEKLWESYWRVVKPNAAIVLTAQQPFTSALVMSQPNHFKYEWIWAKSRPSGHLNAKKQPMKDHESVLVFYKKQCVYNPIFEIGLPNHVTNDKVVDKKSDNYGKQRSVVETATPIKYPRTIQKFTNISPTAKDAIHPTQKPVALFEYMIKTYTNPGETVLDNCSGSGTTAIAARNTGRQWICIEQDEDYFEKSRQRIEKHAILDV